MHVLAGWVVGMLALLCFSLLYNTEQTSKRGHFGVSGDVLITYPFDRAHYRAFKYHE